MDKITKAEYRILRACARKPCKIDDNQANILMGYKYIRPDYNNEKHYVIEREGQIAYEHYRDHMYERRAVSFRAWLAIAISVVSVGITAFHAFLCLNNKM